MSLIGVFHRYTYIFHGYSGISVVFRYFGDSCDPTVFISSVSSLSFLFLFLSCPSLSYLLLRGHPRAFREGEVLRQFQDFREKFWSEFWISLYILYIFTSPSTQGREVSQFRETFFPKSPSRMTPVLLSLFFLSLEDDTKWPTRVGVSLNPNRVKNQQRCHKLALWTHSELWPKLSGERLLKAPLQPNHWNA